MEHWDPEVGSPVSMHELAKQWGVPTALLPAGGVGGVGGRRNVRPAAACLRIG
jgi:hypothetical protein